MPAGNHMDSWDGPSSGRGQTGPLVLGVPWPVPPVLVRSAAGLAAALEVHLLCAFVDPASYLTEWEPASALPAASLDPAANEEATYPAAEVRERLEEIFGNGQLDWTLRVLNGDVSSALTRLADSTGAGMFIVGSGREGLVPRMSRFLEGSVSARLLRLQSRPVVVVPDHRARPPKPAGGHHRPAA